MRQQVLQAVRERGLIHAGDRVGVAVSGGADSVALLRVLHELGKELGTVLTVLHFHHGIRGAEADRDERFVAALAESLGLECVIGRGDAPGHARLSTQSLETAARELRYRFFESVLRSGAVDQVATAHTMDDQAETVLMRLLRGAGTRGLAGIHPSKDAGRFVRPLLAVRRAEIEDYLRSLKQDWREDATNEERKHYRNRVRHELLPTLARDFNPNVVEVLARSAELAQGEEEYWAAEVERLLPLVLLPGKPTRGGGRRTTGQREALAFSLEALQKQPIALQRRLLLAALRRAEVELDSRHLESLLGVAGGKEKSAELPAGWRARRSFRELWLEPPTAEAEGGGYSFTLPVPGKTVIPEMRLLVQARLEPIAPVKEGYNSGEVPEELLLQDHVLTLRSWRAGDRFQPGHSKGLKKVKEILQQLKVPASQRQHWPVVAAGETLIWVRGARPRPVVFQQDGRPARLVIEAQETPEI